MLFSAVPSRFLENLQEDSASSLLSLFECLIILAVNIFLISSQNLPCYNLWWFSLVLLPCISVTSLVSSHPLSYHGIIGYDTFDSLPTQANSETGRQSHRYSLSLTVILRFASQMAIEVYLITAARIVHLLVCSLCRLSRKRWIKPEKVAPALW